jgi:hypothetical protein
VTVGTESKDRAFLRHSLAVVAYRGRKVVSDPPADFAAFRLSAKARSPSEILAHIGDLLDWSLSLGRGEQVWRDSRPLSWAAEVERFVAALERLDDYLASAAPLACAAERLFQGPVADALTHVGQLAMLRRAAGAPIKGENYFKAEITAGRVGLDQAAARREFE